MHKFFYGLAAAFGLAGVAFVVVAVLGSTGPSSGLGYWALLPYGVGSLSLAVVCLFAAGVLHRLAAIAETNAALLQTVRGNQRD